MKTPRLLKLVREDFTGQTDRRDSDDNSCVNKCVTFDVEPSANTTNQKPHGRLYGRRRKGAVDIPYCLGGVFTYETYVGLFPHLP